MGIQRKNDDGTITEEFEVIGSEAEANAFIDGLKCGAGESITDINISGENNHWIIYATWIAINR